MHPALDILDGAPPPAPPAVNAYHEQLLTSLLALDFSLPRLAALHRLSVAQLAAFTADPEVQAQLAEFQRFADELADLSRSFARPTAIAALQQVASDPANDPTERRRAATAILRPAPRPHFTSETPPLDPPSSPTPSPHAPEVAHAVAPREAADPKPGDRGIERRTVTTHLPDNHDHEHPAFEPEQSEPLHIASSISPTSALAPFAKSDPVFLRHLAATPFPPEDAEPTAPVAVTSADANLPEARSRPPPRSVEHPP